jgi:hypothetical protein
MFPLFIIMAIFVGIYISKRHIFPPKILARQIYYIHQNHVLDNKHFFIIKENTSLKSIENCCNSSFAKSGTWPRRGRAYSRIFEVCLKSIKNMYTLLYRYQAHESLSNL